MMRFAPFAPLRPQPELAAQIASVPYDVVSTSEARRLAADEPLSFLRVVRSEVDLPESADPYSDHVYERASRNLQHLVDFGYMIHEHEPKVYLYQLQLNSHRQIGVVGCCHLDDYAQGIVRKHENTRQDKEDDRTRHILALGAQPEPVLLTYRDHHQIDSQIRSDRTFAGGDTGGEPIYDFTAIDGVRHTVWEAPDPQPYIDMFADVPSAYIADGHHRTAGAIRAALKLRNQNRATGGHTGEEPYNWILAALFPASQLRILPYNRLVRDESDRDAAELIYQMRQSREIRKVEPTDASVPSEPGRVCVYLDKQWHEVVFDESAINQSDPVRSLDVTLLQELILEPVFGIADPRTDTRIDFVGGMCGTDELQSRVDSGEATVAFSLYPTSIEQLLAVADAGTIMPPKSTWFEPKLRSGLFVHSIR